MQSAAMFSGVYVRTWRVTILAKTTPNVPRSLLDLLVRSPDYQAKGDDLIVKSTSGKECGLKLAELSGDIRLYFPAAVMGAGTGLSPVPVPVPWITGNDGNDAGRLWPVATRGVDWTENCTELLNTVWVSSNGAGTVTAFLCMYMKKSPLTA